jgi:preprotein translocase subunit SecD
MRLFVEGLLAALLAGAPLGAWAGESMELHVEHVSVVKDIGDQPALKIELTAASKEAFGAFTNRNIGKVADLKVDGKVVMSPIVREPILGGELVISGNFTREAVVAMAKQVEAADAKVEVEARDN